MRWLDAVRHALAISASMTWQILWALIFGFVLSAVVQAVIRRSTMVGGGWATTTPRSLLIATGFGIASSSCSYTAVALTVPSSGRVPASPRRWCSSYASTNLVVELGVILAVLIGWQFTLAEFVGGPIMIVLIAVVFRLFLRQRLIGGCQGSERQGLVGLDGGSRRNGHDHRRGRDPASPPVVEEGPHLGVTRLHHGVGGCYPRRGPRIVDRRCGRRVGAGQFLASLLRGRPPAAVEDLGTS